VLDGMNKEELVTIVKQWVKSDNEIRTLKMEIKRRENEKKELNNRLMSIMRDNELGSFHINDGNINYSKRNVKKPISIKFIHRILGEYYKENEQKASELEEFILSNREVNEKEVITRKFIKEENRSDLREDGSILTDNM
jgi:Family of unknown function (DUF5760)